MKRKTHTQNLIEAIMVKHKCKSLTEAWDIYHGMYEELDPKRANSFVSKPIRNLRDAELHTQEADNS
jgi:hypothetical protein